VAYLSPARLGTKQSGVTSKEYPRLTQVLQNYGLPKG
jgi:hypothetical protein